jgi:S1-C subfamily serine protease
MATTAAAVLSAAGPTVVRIGRQGGRGCGIVVAEGAVLTNAHNLRDRTTEVTFANGRAVQGEVRAVDVDADLVVLSVDTTGSPTALWAEATAEAGAPVYAVVRTPNGGIRVTEGIVSSLDAELRGPRGRKAAHALEHTAPLSQGSSGSPVLDEGGRVVGVTSARLEHGFSLALPADADLRARVDALLRGESRRPRTLGIGLAPAEVSARLRASVGLAPREGLLVRAVDPDAPAAAAGVQAGDLVVGAGGAPVASVDDLHRALDAAGDTLELALVRGNEDLTVVVAFAPPEGEAAGEG